LHLPQRFDVLFARRQVGEIEAAAGQDEGAMVGAPFVLAGAQQDAAIENDQRPGGVR